MKWKTTLHGSKWQKIERWKVMESEYTQRAAAAASGQCDTQSKPSARSNPTSTLIERREVRRWRGGQHHTAFDVTWETVILYIGSSRVTWSSVQEISCLWRSSSPSIWLLKSWWAQIKRSYESAIFFPEPPLVLSWIRRFRSVAPGNFFWIQTNLSQHTLIDYIYHLTLRIVFYTMQQESSLLVRKGPHVWQILCSTGHDPSTQVRRARSLDIRWMTSPECVIVIVIVRSAVPKYELMAEAAFVGTHWSCRGRGRRYSTGSAGLLVAQSSLFRRDIRKSGLLQRHMSAHIARNSQRRIASGGSPLGTLGETRSRRST